MDKDQSLCIVTYFCEEGDLFNKIKARAATQQYFNEDDIMDIFIQVMQPPVPGTFCVALDLLSWLGHACLLNNDRLDLVKHQDSVLTSLQLSRQDA